ncbi:hypothetical protein CRENBAI_026656 [Crenichthys baileyi]|uniref:Uncharacterized protein n=1 Tax=Crenichthys baileyi TaxID=28760 RepID=A0AAV9QSF1_9TELE
MVPAHYLQTHPLKKNRRTQLGNIHLPVHTPSFAFSPRKKGQFFSNWRSQVPAGSLPANHRRCGEGLYPPTSLSSLSLNNSGIDPLTQFLVLVHPSFNKSTCCSALLLPGSHLLCILCGTPAQEEDPLALQTEGMCLPGSSTEEIRTLIAERGKQEDGGWE